MGVVCWEGRGGEGVRDVLHVSGMRDVRDVRDMRDLSGVRRDELYCLTLPSSTMCWPRPAWQESCLPSSPSQLTGQRPFCSVRTPSYP